jgi:hypothetical protein
MIVFDLQTTVNKFAFRIFGSDTEKRLGSFLFDDDKDWASSREIHGLAALTFNDHECAVLMALLDRALDPKDSTWLTLAKTLKLMHHFVIYGAERCVDSAWDMQRRVEELCIYNSALHSRTGELMKGGTDYGAPVRRAAMELNDLLKDTNRIRRERESHREPDSLLPIGKADDYIPAQKPPELNPSASSFDSFGVVRTDALGAKFDLNTVPGMYDGRPSRYFDDTNDERAKYGGIEDAPSTRNYLAGDLLDLDLDDSAAVPSSVPEAQDLIALTKQTELEDQLRQQRQQLDQLKSILSQQQQQQQQQNQFSGGMGAGQGHLQYSAPVGHGNLMTPNLYSAAPAMQQGQPAMQQGQPAIQQGQYQYQNLQMQHPMMMMQGGHQQLPSRPLSGQNAMTPMHQMSQNTMMMPSTTMQQLTQQHLGMAGQPTGFGVPGGIKRNP